MMKRVFFLLGCAVCVASQAAAQTVTDERVWGTIVVQQHVPQDSPWRWVFEGYVRSREGFDEVDSAGVRPTLIYALNSHSSVGVGYGVVGSFPATGGTTLENRPYGQYIWTGPGAGGTWTLRSRLEARFVEGNSATVGRFREQVRYVRAIHKGGKVSAVGWDEFQIHLNDTTKYARGVDQNRAFGGVAVTLSKAARLETGYLNQFLPGHRGAADRMNHIWASSFVVTY